MSFLELYITLNLFKESIKNLTTQQRANDVLKRTILHENTQSLDSEPLPIFKIVY